jgi:hypothetical protein
MSASPLSLLRAGPPAPKVALLPDSMFFVRSVPVQPAPAGRGGAIPAEVTSQVELALEGVSPFPLAHLYHGYYWVPGSPHALAFAAYRRRFTDEQVASWEGAEVVMPAFAALLGAEVEPATTIVLASSGGLTAIHWGAGPVPSRVVFHAVPAEATDEQRAAAREALLKSVGESRKVIDLAEEPAPQSRRSDREIVFRSGDMVSRLPGPSAAAADVRDKQELVSIRRARRRDELIWRTGIGCLAAFAVMAVLELGLAGGGLWQRSRLRVIRFQQPVVDNIMTAQDLARKITELSTKRLLPIEMIKLVAPRRFGTSIQFLSASTSGLYTLSVSAQTSNTGEIRGYQSALEALPACEKVEVRDLRSQNGNTSFTLVVTFKPDGLRPSSPS